MSGKGLVLGGGGITGIAWELGVIAGLAEQGVDLTAADVVVGTSAGSAVGALVLSGTRIDDLYAALLGAPASETGWRIGMTALARFMVAAAWPGDGRRGRMHLGRAALAARTMPESEFRDLFVAMLPTRTWPERRLLVTAVDADSGEPMVFTRDSGVDLPEAVAASCAVPLVMPPVTVGGRRYLDGGMRSIANADLATACDRVIVLAPVDFGLKRSQRVRHQLRRLGAEVRWTVVTPDAVARRAIGPNPLSATRRAAAARAGHDQAARVAGAVRAVWLASSTAQTIVS